MKTKPSMIKIFKNPRYRGKHVVLAAGKIYPFSQIELSRLCNHFELKQKLPERLIFGSYPAVLTAASKNDKIEKLTELVNSYLLKDILELEKVKGSKVLSFRA